MDNQTRRSARRTSAGPSRPIRTTASYMYAPKTDAAPEENASRSKKSARKRKNNENVSKKPFPWQKVLIGAGVLVVIAAVLLLILSLEPKTYHQMPKVTPPEQVETVEESL